jgi:transcriptional regulator with XRE-family HTH domain
MITAAQMRAARAFLRWSAQDLSKQSGLSHPTIQRMESADGVPSSYSKNLKVIRDTFAAAGIIFIGGDDDEIVGVMLRDKSAGS